MSTSMLDDATAHDSPSDDSQSDAPMAYLSRMNATYSPEDNKLRLYTMSRLDEETYKRVRDAGFKWAPKQELWVAPMWTPERAALLVELCGEIGDEDTSLVARAEARADRFEDYSAKRADDARAARDAVSRIADGIPLGQPIIVGHHSEKRARKDAERIQSGMRRAVQMWETSEYWVSRAKGALSHAKYKERPDVRHRRIKGLESDKRKHEKEIAQSERFSALWAKVAECTDAEKAGRMALEIANHDQRLPCGTWSKLESCEIHAPEASTFAIAHHAKWLAHSRCWLAHVEGRLAYERAMLDEQGGTAADKFSIEIGGRVMSRHWRARGKGWVVVTKINRDATGAIGSVSTTDGVIEIESVDDYRAPEAGDAAKVKASKKLAPLVNYPGDGFRHMTQAEYATRAKHSDCYHVRKVAASDKYGAHRCRNAPEPGGSWKMTGVYLTDAKRADPPAPSEPVVDAAELAPKPAPVAAKPARAKRERTEFDDMKDAIRDGVAVVAVSAPELFPTPSALAARMVEIAGVRSGMRVLEPSAGTGSIVREIAKTGAAVVAVEIEGKLARALASQYPAYEVVCTGFETASGLGRFDAVVMNPPFSAELDHVYRAFGLLREGGVLVSVMSAGVKFRGDKASKEFRAFVEANRGGIEGLPEGTFASSGTSVRTVLVTLRNS